MEGNALDLAALDTCKGGEQGFDLDLKHPATGQPLGKRIRVRGYDSESYQAALRAQQRLRLERLPSQRPTPESIERDALTTCAALVGGWDAGQFTLEGRAFDYDGPESAHRMVQRFPWIREQVEQAAGERGNFLPGSAGA